MIALRRPAHAVLDPEDMADLPRVATKAMKVIIRNGVECPVSLDAPGSPIAD